MLEFPAPTTNIMSLLSTVFVLEMNEHVVELVVSPVYMDRAPNIGLMSSCIGLGRQPPPTAGSIAGGPL